MIAQNSFVCVFFAAFCLVVSYGSTLPGSQKCVKDDNACVSKKFTDIIQNYEKYPELELPSLEPYRPPESWVFNGSNPLNYEIQTSQMKCDGFKNLVVKEFSGFSTDADGSKFTVKLFMDKIKVETDFVGRVKLPVVGEIKPEAVLNIEMIGAEMPITVTGEFVQRDGKDYFNIKNVDSDLFLSNVKSDVSINGSWFQKLKESFWTGPATVLLNLEWKLIKAELDKDKEKFNAIIKDIFSKILDKVAVQDIFQN